MIRKLFRDIPLWYVVLFFIIYLPLYGFDFWIASLGGEEMPVEFVRCKVGILGLFAGLLGFLRIKRFHPAFNRDYFSWLAFTPWKYGMKLPRGSVFSTLSDGAVVAILTLLTYFNDSYLVLVPLVAYLVAYTLMVMYNLAVSKQMVYVAAFFFALPFTVYPHLNFNISVLAFTGFYCIACLGLRDWLRHFPWNTVYWNYDQRKVLLDHALTSNIINWPYKMLRAYGFDDGISLRTSLIVSLLVVWWHHVASWIYKDTGILFYFLPWAMAVLFRTAYSKHGLPPISLVGRLVTGRYIIPGYDKIFIAPVCVAISGVLMPRTLISFGLNFRLSYDISLFLFLMLAFLLPPTIKEWCLTGSHRIPKPLNKNPGVNRSSSDIFIENMIRETFQGKS